jgi:hypothetical protein
MRTGRLLFSLWLLSLGGLPCSSAQSAKYSDNYSNCLNGYYTCDAAALTAQEQTTVSEAARRRNYANCLNGYYTCDAAGLTAQEQAAVSEAARRRTYYNCLNGYYGCDATGLSAQERSQIENDERSRGPRVSLPASTGAGTSVSAGAPESAVAPACAENGSCYGDISEQTGRPKTVNVRGYYRKDGTYVRGHYRSAPRR